MRTSAGTGRDTRTGWRATRSRWPSAWWWRRGTPTWRPRRARILSSGCARGGAAGYDPAVVDAFDRVGPDAFAALDAADEWQTALAGEPGPATTIEPGAMDAALTAFADFADLKSPWIRGHSRRVAELAGAAGRHAGLDDAACDELRRAGLVHDLGRVGVENGIWDKPGAADDVRVGAGAPSRVPHRADPGALRLARIAGRAGFVAPRAARRLRLSPLARADAQSRGDRILAAADVFAALTADRPHRPALPDAEAARALETEAEERLDPEAVACVLAAAGQREVPASAGWPAGLTDREVEVLRLIARGRSNREVAERLFISPKTVGRHVENVYAKIEVSSRAAAALFAMEHRLLD